MKENIYKGASEEEEQIMLFSWARMYEYRYPQLKWLYAIPNGGYRTKSQAARLKASGVKKGVSDMCLPYPAGGAHGLYIELKRTDGGKASKEQLEFIEDVTKAGYVAKVCHGWQAAAELILRYLKTSEELGMRSEELRCSPAANELKAKGEQK